MPFTPFFAMPLRYATLSIIAAIDISPCRRLRFHLRRHSIDDFHYFIIIRHYFFDDDIISFHY
jgi:hypothetical protein